MVYGRYNYSIHGVYKPTSNWGAPSCMDLGHGFWADLETTPGGKVTEDAQKGVLKHTGYGSTMAVCLGEKKNPKELSVLGMLLIFADGWSHHSCVFGLLGWKRGSDMSWHRFMHLKILKSLRKTLWNIMEHYGTLWNIMEHSKHLENYKWLGAFELGNWSSPGKGMSWSLILTRHDSLSENWRVSSEKRDIGDWHVFWFGNLIIGWLL